jgi:RND family efflux transporter MFP subunit
LPAAGLLAAAAWLFPVGYAAGQEAKPPAPPPTPVVVAPVQEVTDSPTATYSGFLEPIDQARVSALEAGSVKTIHKRTGERVKRGEVLAVLAGPQLQLDLEVTEAQVKEAEAALAEAQLKLNRLRLLYEKELTPAEQYENEKAAVAVIAARLETTRAARDRLRERLKLLVVRAPVDGQVIAYDLKLGEWVTQNKELYQIANFEQIQVLIGVPARHVNTVPEGAPVALAVPELGAKLTGRIQAVVRHVDAQSGNFQMRVVVENHKGLVLSGLLAQVTVPTGAPSVVKVVPRDAIVRRGEATQVVVVRENTAQVVPVKVAGGLGDGVIVVAAELKPKEQVVVRGNERLFPGMPVSVTSAQ